jgi:hypothetical protein
VTVRNKLCGIIKGEFYRIRFISELRNKQVNPDLFRERFGLNKTQLIDYLTEAGYEVNQRSMVKDESPT